MAYHLRHVKGQLDLRVFVLFVVLSAVQAQDLDSNYKVIYKRIPDNRGVEFVIAFMQQFRKELDGATRLFITSDYNTRVVITSPETNVRKELEVKSRRLYPVDFPTSVRMHGTQIEKKGIHIKADNEIVVYGLNIKKFTTDAYLALPIDIQSTMYIVPSFTPSQTSLIGIVGIYDRTTIFVTFRFEDRKSSFKFRGKKFSHKDTLSVTLSRLETFQIAHSSDMTGTRIFSTRPISVFSGNECANVPLEKGYCDHLVEHIPPVNTWGQRFITAPLRDRTGGDFFRILAANESTDVQINGKHVVRLNEGEYHEIDVPSTKYQYIQTSRPSLVLQFSKGSKVDETNTDPFMIMIPPVEQYTAQYTVSTPDQNEKYFQSYINIIIETQQIDGLRLDGRSLREEKWVPVWGTKHSAARVVVSHGVHRVMHDSPIVPFAIFLYGYARADSYGYPGGLRLADLTLECVPGKPGDGLDNDCDRRIDEEIKNFIDDDDDGRIDEDLVTDPPEIDLDVQTLMLSGCPKEVKQRLKKPTVTSAPLCSSRGPFKLSFVDSMREKECVQYIERMWIVKDGCGNIANATQKIRIKRPEMQVSFPEDVRGKCHLAEDLSVTGEPKVLMSCREDQFVVKHKDMPALSECTEGGRTVGREWTVKVSCGSSIKHVQKLLPDVTPPKVTFVGKRPLRVRGEFRIAWNASEESTFKCSFGGRKDLLDCGSGWSSFISKSDLPDGKYQFLVQPTDLAGNTGAFISHPFQVDRTGPRLAFKPVPKSLYNGPVAIEWKSTEMALFKCGFSSDRLSECGSGMSERKYLRDLRDGTYTFYVGAQDDLGNQADLIKHTFRVDSTPPRIKFGKSLKPTINSKVDLPILSNEFAKFSCSLDGQAYTACGEGSEGRFSARNLAEGPHELRVKAVDEAGNVAKPISLKWNSDKTSPNILFTPGLPTKFRGGPRITWSSTEYARFECALDDSTRFSPCGRGTKEEWRRNNVPQGDHDFFVRGTDRYGNVGPTARFSFSIDNTPPKVRLVKPLPTTSRSRISTFRWTSDEMAFYKCAVDDSSRLQDCGSGRSADWTTPQLDNGRHTFFLIATDEVGNKAPLVRHSWKIDTVAPRLKFRGRLPKDTNSNKQTFSWTSSEYAEFLCFVDSETVSSPCGSGTSGSWTSDELDDGPHTFRVFGTDNHGNKGPVIQHKWSIDTKVPGVKLNKVPKSINKPKVRFSWTSSEPAKFKCAVDGDREGQACGTGTDGQWETPTLADGEHEFRLLVEDMVGNMAPLVRSKFDIDTSRPVITFDKPSPKTPQKDLSVTWKSSEDSKFECALDDITQYEECGQGKTGAFQKTDLPDGRHKLYVRGTDSVGNTGQPSVYTVTTDRSPPSLKFTDKSKSLSKNPSESFTWTSDETAKFKCKVDEREETDCGEGKIGVFRTPELPDGEHVFQVTPIDQAKNRGKTLERKWMKDSTPPDVRYTSQPPKVSRETVTFKWSSSEYATFQCALDDTRKASACGSGTSGEKKLTGLPKGSRSFWVRGTDSAGNVGSFVPHYWTVDLNPPGIEFTGDLPSFSKKSLTLTFKSDEESKFECALDNAANFAPCGHGIRGNWTENNLPEGKHTFYVRARDNLDNVGKPISHSWTVDSIPPRAVVNPVRPVVNTPYTTLSWRANERSKFLCAIGDVGNVIECGQGTSGSWKTPYLRRGPQKFWLIAEDYTGNRAEPVIVSWTVDDKAPTVTFSNDSTKESATGKVQFSWTSDESATFECAVQGVSAFEKCGSGTSGTWTSNVPDGKRTFLVRASDPYGNQNEPFSFPFEVDTTAPTGFSVTGPRRRTKKPQATFTWRTSEDAKFDCYLDDKADPIKCGAGTNGQFTTDPLPDGDHKFSVVATDDLGNKGRIVNSKWSIDSTGPKIKLPDNLPRTTLAFPTFNWTSNEPARFDCSLDGKSNWEYCGQGTSSVWQGTNVPDGKHTFFVRGTDDLGNTGPEISHPFTVDNTAPTIAITSQPNRTSSKPTIRWQSSEDVTFKCSLDDGKLENCGKGRDGIWTTNNIPDGRHKFFIQGKDVVGNTGRLIYSWTVDSAPPSIRLQDNLPKTTLANPRFSFTSTEPAIFECSLDGFKTKEDCGSGTSGTWQGIGVPDGTYVFSVRGKDTHENLGTPATHRFTVDNKAPEISISSRPDRSSSRPTIQWTSTEDVTFECALDGKAFTSCGNGRTGSWTGSNVPDGIHTFVVQGKDKVGNTGKHTYKWRIDTQLPVVRLTGKLPTISNRPQVGFTWTSTEEALFTCAVATGNGVPRKEECGYGTFGQYQTNLLPDGQHTFSVTPKDRLGNKGLVVEHTWKQDTKPPVVSFPSDLPTATQTSPTFTWTSSENAKFFCGIDSSANIRECGQGTNGQWTGTSIPDGRHVFVVYGVDDANNRGSYIQHSFVVDSKSPQITFYQPVRDTTGSTVQFRWTSTELATFECSLDGADYENCGQGNRGQWRKTNIPDGRHTFSVRGRDRNGNIGQPTTVSWNVETSGPVIEFAPDSPVATLGSLTLKWKSSKWANFYCSLNDQSARQYCGAGTDGSAPFYNLPDGKHTFYVRGTDAFNNQGTTNSHPFTVDTRAPRITVTKQPDQKSSTPRLEWKATEDVKFECSLDGGVFKSCGEGTTGQWSENNVPDGEHRFVIQGKDKVGNTGRFTFTWNIDTSLPKVTIQEPFPVKTSRRRMVVQWKSDEDASFQCAIDDPNRLRSCGFGGNYLSTRGQWWTPSLPDGEHTFYIIARDKFGNSGPTTSRKWVIDSTPPQVRVTSGKVFRNSTPTFNWVSSENATFECYIDNTWKSEACGSGTNGTFTANNVPSGDHMFYVRAKDGADNYSPNVQFPFKVDSKGPTVSLTQSVPPKTISPKVGFSWTSSEDATFECTLDGNRVDCGSGTRGQYVTPNLPDGKHTFSINTVDSVGNKGRPVTVNWESDSSPPDVKVNPDKSVYSTRSPKFTWSSSEDASFECAIDNTAFYRDCGTGTSGQFTGSNVPDGSHAFFIRGKDKFGNYGPNVQYPFKIDTVGPRTYLTSSVPSRTTNPKLTFTWQSNEDATYECTIDGKKEDCGSGPTGRYTTSRLPDGPHTFSLNTVDKVGNKGTPITVNWETDSTKPEIQFKANLPEETSRTPKVSWSSSEFANYECALNDLDNKIQCGQGTTGQRTLFVPKGRHTFSVRGTDNFGNVGPWKSYSFNVDAEGPKIQFSRNQPTVTKNNPTFKWTSSESAKFKCAIDDSFNLRDCGEGTASQWTGNNIPDGEHEFLVVGTDARNNVGPYARFRFTVDNSAPKITFPRQSVTTNSKPRVRWTSSEDATFECSLDGGDYEKCGKGFNGQWTADNVPHGRHVFSVRGRDKNGNVGTPAKFTWNVDDQAPDVSITSNILPKSRNPQKTITWDSNENAKFECKLDGVVVECGRGTTGTYTTPKLNDGKHTFSVNAVDNVGNKGIPKVVTWTSDTRPPSVYITNTVPPKTNSRKAKITWTSTETGRFECVLDGLVVDCGRGREGEYTTPELPDGRHTFSVRSVDDVGNPSTSQVVNWRTDSRAPNIQFSPNLPKKTKGNPKFTWTSSEPASFECALNDQSRSIRCDSGTSGKWNGINIPHGAHTFWVRGRDDFGNVGKWKPFDFEVDSNGPSIAFYNAPKITKNNPTFSWTSSEPANFKCRMGNSFQEKDCGNGTNGWWSGNEIPDGPHKFFVYGVDKMNNKGPVAELAFNVDASGPVISFSSNQPKVIKKNPSFSWTSSEPAKFKCGIDSLFNLVDCDQGVNGKWKGKNIPDGPHKFLVYGTDDMKNKGPVAEFSFLVDSSGPTITFRRKDKLTGSSPQFTWTSNEEAQFECSVDGKEYKNCGQGRRGVWIGKDVPHGKHVFFVRGIDKNGNVGQPSQHTWNVDTKPPKVAIREPFPKLPTSEKSIRIRFTSDEDANYKCSLDGSSPVPCGFGKKGEWTTPQLPDGEHTFSLIAEDTLGNRAPVVSRKWIVDSTPPKVTFSDGLPETSGRNPTLKWSSSEYANFTCKLDGAKPFQCSSGEKGSWTGVNLPDGRQGFSVSAVDPAGNKGPHVTFAWAVDESAPRLRFIGKLPLRARKMPLIRWQSNEFASFECSTDGANYRNCGAGFTGRWTKTENPSGRTVFYVRGRDRQGNVGQPIYHEIEIDTDGPKIELLKPLPKKTKQPTTTFFWTSNEVTKFQCAVNSLRNRVNCGLGLNGRFTTDPLADGKHVFYLLGEDELGNPARVVAHRWEVDKTKPEVVFLPNQPKLSDGDITILWKTKGENKRAQFECALDNLGDMKECGNGTTGSWSGTGIPDGDHTLYVRPKDSFGDYGVIKSHSWRVDTKVPQVNLIGFPPKRSSYDSGSFYWKSDEDATYQCAVDVVESGVECGSGTQVSWVTQKLNDGNHTFYLFASDDLGNQAKPTEYQWEIDTQPPIVTLDKENEPVTGRSVTIKWKTNEKATFKCALDSIFNNRDCGSGTSSSVKFNDLEDGPHTVWIKAVDDLNNAAPWKEYSWVVDSTPPDLEFTSKLPNKTNGSASFFWRSKEKASLFKCGTDPDKLEDCGTGHSGLWSAKNLTNGKRTFYVEATDDFGNRIRIEHKWRVDNKPPTLEWINKLPLVTGKQVNFRWRSDERADFYCAHEDFNKLEKCGKGLRGNFIEKDLPEGKHLFWVLGVDDVGNRGAPLHHEWTVDTKGPTLFFNEPRPKKSGSSVHFSWRSNENARFFCAINNPRKFVSCGNGMESELKLDHLKRDGEHVLYVKGIDDSGNEGDIISTTWIVDLVAPVLIEVGPLPRLTNKNPIIRWKVNEIAAFECALNDFNNYESCGNGTNGTWIGKDLDTGGHRFVVRAKDPQGNTNNLIDHKFVVGIPDNRGREFMLCFMQQYLERSMGSVSLFITSDNNTVARIYIPALAYDKRFKLEADELIRVDLPLRARMSGTNKQRRGILVEADHELVVYGLNIMQHSTDAFLALPTDIQGTEYYAVSYTVSKNSLIGIVGIEDNTRVWITIRMSEDVPLVYEGAVYRNGDTMIILLDRYESFQLAHAVDLTGTHIRSSEVISVFSGSECANVPKDKGYCDHLVEMLTPTNTWGRRFVTAPLIKRKGGDFFRVVASKDNTRVVFHPNDVAILDAGDFMERDVSSYDHKLIIADKPCLLMQYSKGADVDNTDTDPFMIMIPPIEQYGSHYILSTPDRPTQQYFSSYINIIVLNKDYRGVLVDGRQAHKFANFKQIPGTTYSAAAVAVTKGVHRVDHVSPIVTFGAFMYGYAWRDSYGYPGGLRLANISGCMVGVDTPADGMDNDCDKRIDEELKNGIDDDGDGRIDEDLATFPPEIRLDDPYYEFESCVFQVDALVPRPKAVSSSECNLKGALYMAYTDQTVEKDCTYLINRTWQATDGCGNVVYLNQMIKIIKPKFLVQFPEDKPNGCTGRISMDITGTPLAVSPCPREKVRVAYRDSISVKECQEKGLLLIRSFTVTENCGREYTGKQRIYPGGAK